jgi:hypothetical protein
MMTGYTLAAAEGDTKAAKMVLQIMETRAKILGLNAPTRVVETEREIVFVISTDDAKA